MRPSLLLALCLASAPLGAQVCEPTTPPERQYRTAMKHRAPSVAAPVTVTVAQVLAWLPPPAADDARDREREAPRSATEAGAFTIDGDVWRVKVEDNDCDLHIEFTTPGAAQDAPRVIAEIPSGPAFDAAREAMLRAAGGRLRWRGGDRLDLAAPVRMRFTGYGFWDGAHWCRRDANRGCGHGTSWVATLWELHPVWRAEVLGGSAPVAPTAPATQAMPGATTPVMTPIAPMGPAGPASPGGGPRRVCRDGWVSPCACVHPPRMGCCRGHLGEAGCGGAAAPR